MTRQLIIYYTILYLHFLCVDGISLHNKNAPQQTGNGAVAQNLENMAINAITNSIMGPKIDTTSVNKTAEMKAQFESATAAAKKAALKNGLQQLKNIEEKSQIFKLGSAVQKLRQMILEYPGDLSSTMSVVILPDITEDKNQKIKEEELRKGRDEHLRHQIEKPCAKLVESQNKLENTKDMVYLEPEGQKDLLSSMSSSQRLQFDEKMANEMERKAERLNAELETLLKQAKLQKKYKK